jgi:feruloyl esterase
MLIAIDDTEWDPATFTIEDAAAAIAQNPFTINTWNGDLSGFKNAGGKLSKVP